MRDARKSATVPCHVRRRDILAREACVGDRTCHREHEAIACACLGGTDAYVDGLSAKLASWLIVTASTHSLELDVYSQRHCLFCFDFYDDLPLMPLFVESSECFPPGYFSGH